ncbi:MAG: hypothetical protein K2Y22_10375 [Candidatus Obscuribacterales bacterium]|nr:hypothetical protein [Candidatus Obscuribacterales bacterium]
MDFLKCYDQAANQIEQEKNAKHLAEVSLPTDTLGHWLARIQAAESKDEILSLLDDFRSLAWTDEQRAQMSQTYIRSLDWLEPTKETFDDFAGSPSISTSP